MKKKMPRVLSLALVLAMLLSTFTPAFAQEQGAGSLSLSGESSAQSGAADSTVDSVPADDVSDASPEQPDSASPEQPDSAPAQDAPESDTAKEEVSEAPEAPAAAPEQAPAAQESALVEEDLSDYVLQFGGLQPLETGLPTYYAAYNRQAALQALITGMEQRQSEISIQDYSVPVTDLKGLMTDALNRSPYLFYVAKKYSYYQTTSADGAAIVVSVVPTYDSQYGAQQTEEYNAAVARALQCVNSQMSPLQKALALHDYLAAHMSYDSTLQKHNAYQALVGRNAVCEGYALAYVQLLQKCGVPCEVVISTPMNHAWNAVQLDGSWYHVDVTWDDPTADRVGRVKHSHFLRSDAGITSLDHTGWTFAERCTSTAYDTGAFWAETAAAVIYDGNTAYYIEPKSGTLRQRAADGAEQTIYRDFGRWSAGGTSYWQGVFSGLARGGDKLYWNDSGKVYEWTIGSAEPSSAVYTLDAAQGSLYGCHYWDGTLELAVGENPNKTTSQTYRLPNPPEGGFIKGTEAGSDYSWKLDAATGTLTVKGTKMADWGGSSPAPWDFAKASIRSVVIEPGMTNIGAYAFFNCSGLTGALALPDGLISIGENAFYGCSGLTGALTIPSGVTSIGDGAFWRCTGLTGALTIPSSVTSIGAAAFTGCGGLTGDLKLPAGVTSIGSGAFSSCSGLTGVLTIPSGVTTIEALAFNGCSGLTGELTIPAGVTSIGNYAFSGCSGLTGELTIPAGVTSIGTDAFASCTGLQKVLFMGDAPAFPETGEIFIFAGVTATVYYPQNNATWTAEKRQNYGGTLTWVAYDPANPPAEDGFIKGTEAGSDYWWKLDTATGTLTVKGTKLPNFTPCSGPTSPLSSNAPWNSQMDAIRTVVIEPGVANIGAYTFYGYEKITAVALPAGLTEIGEDAFNACRGLTSVSIPDGVTKIGAEAFMNCTSLSEIELPESATDIGFRAFVACPLKEITLPSGMTEIKDRLFISCSGLKSITIPAGVTSVGESAFYGCTGLQKVLFTGDAPAFLETNGYGLRNFVDVTATVYYPQDNATWTAEKRQNYGGTLTWVAYDPANPPDLDAPDAVTPTPESPYQTETFGTGENSVDMLSHVAPGTTLTALKANLENGAELVVKDASGKVLSAGAPVGTGCTVGFGDDGETGKVVVMIDGDVDGNSKITMLDVVSMRQSILRIKSLRGAYLRAAMPVTQTGSGPKLNDVTRVRQYLLRIVSSVAK